MKKYLILLILSLSITTQTFSQTDVMQYPSYEPKKNGLGSKLSRLFTAPITKEGLVKGAKIASTFVVANKFKFVVAGGAVLTGVAGYNYLIQHPDRMSEFFATHPELLDEFTRYVDYRIENAQTQEEFDTFNNVKQKAFLNDTENSNEDAILQNNFAFKQIQENVELNIKNIDIQLIQLNKMPNNCNRQSLEQLTMDKDSFENTINMFLPKIQTNLNITTILDVNTYRNLKIGYQNSDKFIILEQDHIPSYAAIDKFLNRLGISTKTRTRTDSKGTNKTVRDKDLEFNETAISVPKAIHEAGRTYYGKNSTKKIEFDSNNLLIATILDISTTAFAFTQNPSYGISADQYINSAMMIYLRNKLLCLYDVK